MLAIRRPRRPWRQPDTAPALVEVIPLRMRNFYSDNPHPVAQHVVTFAPTKRRNPKEIRFRERMLCIRKALPRRNEIQNPTKSKRMLLLKGAPKDKKKIVRRARSPDGVGRDEVAGRTSFPVVSKHFLRVPHASDVGCRNLVSCPNLDYV